jgi:biopolymer transport protein ExbD
MAKREIPEINAGSMADIAFLLLIFFLVTTTIDNEQGIPSLLPQKYNDPNYKPPQVKVRDKDMLSVTANFKDELLVESDIIPLDELKDKVKEFYGNPFSGAERDDFPTRSLVNAEICQQKIGELQEAYDADPSNTFFKYKLNEWKDKLQALDIIGDFYEMPPSSIIFFKSDNGTSYGFYIGIINELNAGVNELRNEYCLQKFGVPFSKLDEENPDDKKKISAVKFLYPNKIAEITK